MLVLVLFLFFAKPSLAKEYFPANPALHHVTMQMLHRRYQLAEDYLSDSYSTVYQT